KVLEEDEITDETLEGGVSRFVSSKTCVLIWMEIFIFKWALMSGRQYTWANSRQTSTFEKLDRILIRKLRQYLRGWAKHTSGINKKEKKSLLNKLDELDRRAKLANFLYKLRRDDIPQVNSLENEVLAFWDTEVDEKAGQLSGLKAVNMKMLLCAFEQFIALEKQKLKNINMHSSLIGI
ncbi:hypothetical protein ACJX0J_019700, partial [Zea mays]